ncbi:zinc ribbon domain-containing protein [Mycolicibacterium palauense]|uniref:zinc ribbon domain-containing protein n=1 Tax=Mycolicibacterium palauense TaxID=2034511 RepID=UPI000BFEB892|nr:C4-type zinc ribbon domain-containing protein [Mycolicibacterium palauense]
MKAEVTQQRSLLDLAELDAELARITHRAGHLDEQQRYEQLQAEHQEATDRAAVAGIALEDLDGQVSRFESEIDAVRQREDRDRSLLDSAGVNPKQLGELQHELQTLERRQSSLEDSLLEVMERREELAGQAAAERAAIEALQGDLDAARQARDAALADVEQKRTECQARREELAAGLEANLLALYERQRASSGVGAGVLRGNRCGACRIEIDRGEMAKISAAAEDEVLRCPECGAILLRVKA